MDTFKYKRISKALCEYSISTQLGERDNEAERNLKRPKHEAFSGSQKALWIEVQPESNCLATVKRA